MLLRTSSGSICPANSAAAGSQVPSSVSPCLASPLLAAREDESARAITRNDVSRMEISFASGLGPPARPHRRPRTSGGQEVVFLVPQHGLEVADLPPVMDDVDHREAGELG